MAPSVAILWRVEGYFTPKGVPPGELMGFDSLKVLHG